MKGASVLCIHQPFNLVKGTVIDGLHSIFIGVVKQLLKLWTDKANRGKDYYIGNKVHCMHTSYCIFGVCLLLCSNARFHLWTVGSYPVKL